MSLRQLYFTIYVPLVSNYCAERSAGATSTRPERTTPNPTYHISRGMTSRQNNVYRYTFASGRPNQHPRRVHGICCCSCGQMRPSSRPIRGGGAARPTNRGTRSRGLYHRVTSSRSQSFITVTATSTSCSSPPLWQFRIQQLTYYVAILKPSLLLNGLVCMFVLYFVVHCNQQSISHKYRERHRATYEGILTTSKSEGKILIGTNSISILQEVADLHSTFRP